MLHPYQNKFPQIEPDVFVATGAQVVGDVEIGASSSVWFNAVIRGDVFPVRIGARTNIQDHAVIHVTGGQHATQVGAEVTVGHRAILHGCIVENLALIGMGAIVLDGALIGESSLIGAGSLVTPEMVIPPRTLAFGSPCRVIRELTEAELNFLRFSAWHYVELAQEYLRQSLKRIKPP